nr:hypothetical protein [Candidatus Bathyarchaeota archaeon]
MVKLGRSKVDESVIKLLIEEISNINRRLKRVEEQISVLIQETYGFKILKNEEEEGTEKICNINDCRVKEGDGEEVIEEEQLKEHKGHEKEEKKEKIEGRKGIPIVKLAS